MIQQSINALLGLLNYCYQSQSGNEKEQTQIIQVFIFNYYYNLILFIRLLLIHFESYLKLQLKEKEDYHNVMVLQYLKN